MVTAAAVAALLVIKQILRRAGEDTSKHSRTGTLAHTHCNSALLLLDHTAFDGHVCQLDNIFAYVNGAGAGDFRRRRSGG